MDSIYAQKTDSQCSLKLKNFLEASDRDFPIPLSHKVNIDELLQKLLDFGMVFSIMCDGRIIAACCGYANDLSEKKAYISVVATLKDFRGAGYGEMCVRAFLEEAARLGMKSAFLYTHSTNHGAIRLYKRIGFYEIPSDREGDVKLKMEFGKWSR